MDAIQGIYRLEALNEQRANLSAYLQMASGPQFAIDQRRIKSIETAISEIKDDLRQHIRAVAAQEPEALIECILKLYTIDASHMINALVPSTFISLDKQALANESLSASVAAIAMLKQTLNSRSEENAIRHSA